MAWEISHTPEAWECYRRGLEAQTREWLEEALATAMADKESDTNYDWIYLYEATLEKFHVDNPSKEDLVQGCIDQTEEHRTCSNGGHEFYVDREGWNSIRLEDYQDDDADS